MDFPVSDFSIQTFTSTDFFENLYDIIILKIHLHHLYVTDKIHGYTYDFCNHKARENKIILSCLVLIFILW